MQAGMKARHHLPERASGAGSERYYPFSARREGFMCDIFEKTKKSTASFATLKERYGKLHTLVHSVAYAPADELKGEFINTRRRFSRPHWMSSVYSLVAVAPRRCGPYGRRADRPHHDYYVPKKVVPRYNVMAVAKAGLECSDPLSPPTN